MKTRLSFLSLLLASLGLAQSPCDLQEKNSQWKLAFQDARDKAHQLQLIKEKVVADMAYMDYNAEFKTHDVKHSTVDKAGNDCGCRILFHLLANGKPVMLNLSRNTGVQEILDAMDSSNIVEIIPMFDEKAIKLYGTLGKCGAVMLKSSNKKISNIVKRVGP